MPEQETLTPGQEPAETLTSEPGPETPGQATEPSESAAPDYKEKFAQSTAEAQRLWHQGQAAAAEAAQLRAQLAQQNAAIQQWQLAQQQRQVEAQDTGSEQETQDYQTAIENRDFAKIKAIDSAREQRITRTAAIAAKNEVLRDVVGAARQSSKINAAVQYLQQSPVNQAVFNEAALEYQRLANDGYTPNIVEQAQWQMPNGGPIINPHIMRIALQNVQGRMQVSRARAEQQTAQGEYFVEPSNRPANTGGKLSDYTKLLTPVELDMMRRPIAGRKSPTPKEFFESLAPDIRAERLRTGKPVTRQKTVIR